MILGDRHLIFPTLGRITWCRVRGNGLKGLGGAKAVSRRRRRRTIANVPGVSPVMHHDTYTVHK